MRVALLLPLFFLISCASGPERNIASTEIIIYGDVDSSLSSVKPFPDTGHPDIHHFYLELRNSKKKLIDVELREIVIKEDKKILTSHLRRISLGRYEVEIDKENLDIKNLKFAVQKKSVKHKLLSFKKPVQMHSSMVILSNEAHRLTIRLTLKDKNASLVQVQILPDVVFMGSGDLSTPKMVKTGIWEFHLDYPDENQIFYLSVRANGVLLEKLLRYQHVEK